jgi:hypothetical protein
MQSALQSLSAGSSKPVGRHGKPKQKKISAIDHGTNLGKSGRTINPRQKITEANTTNTLLILSHRDISSHHEAMRERMEEFISHQRIQDYEADAGAIVRP